MKSLMIYKSKLRVIFRFLFLALIFFLSGTKVLAADVAVSASIPDTQAPSVPILIAPSDGALLSDNTPSFSWHEATDNVALSHYALYLNSSLVYNNIPLITTDNSSYTLQYDALNGTYTLTPKNALSDRAYTWNIVAVDYANLSTSSDVWDFTIDTLVPTFVLQKIGDTDVNISAGNPGSVPSEPIIIFKNDATANEPILIAEGEANSEVKLTVTIPDDTTQTFTQQINASGDYELKLGIMPRGKDIRLDFIITDPVSHVSVLEKVYFRIELQYWPTSTPTPTPSALTPTPSISPILSTSVTTKPSTSVTREPSISVSPQPTGIIPIIPPKEIVHEISDELLETLPESTADQLKAFLRSAFWLNLAPLVGLLVFLSFYFFSFLLLLSKFFGDLSLILLKKMFFLLFPTFTSAKKNLVFEYQETVASPLVKVELLDQNKQVIDFAITNLQGNFADFELAKQANKQWFLKVNDPNFYYPIGDAKPAQLAFYHFYQGQEFNQENYHGQAVLIPTLRAAGQDKLPFFERMRIFVLYLLNYPWWFLILCFLFNLVFLMRYFSLPGVVAGLFYGVILVFKMISLYMNQKTLVVTTQLDNQQQFNGNLVFSFSPENKNLAQSMVLPFEFSKSKSIKHNFSQASLTAFAKNFALIKDDKLIDGQEMSFSRSQEEVMISIKKT